MATHEIRDTREQRTSVVLRPGDYILLGQNTDIDYDEDNRIEGYADSVLFEGEVETHIPQTGKLRFTEETRTEDIGKEQFNTYLGVCDRIEIIKR